MRALELFGLLWIGADNVNFSSVCAWGQPWCTTGWLRMWATGLAPVAWLALLRTGSYAGLCPAVGRLGIISILYLLVIKTTQLPPSYRWGSKVPNRITNLKFSWRLYILWWGLGWCWHFLNTVTKPHIPLGCQIWSYVGHWHHNPHYYRSLNFLLPSSCFHYPLSRGCCYNILGAAGHPGGSWLCPLSLWISL